MEKCTPPETRTQNLLLRRQTPYPLGQWGITSNSFALYIRRTNWRKDEMLTEDKEMQYLFSKMEARSFEIIVK